MKIVEFSVKRPVTMSILVALILILGFFTFSRLGVDLYPNIKLPVAAIMTTYAGAGPEEVETQVTKPIEGMVSMISNVKDVESISSSGSSIIIIWFNWGTDMDTATQDIREKVGIIDKYLPDGAEKPMVVKMDPTMMPILQIGLYGGESQAEMQSVAENLVKPRLARIPGVASVEITGGKTREMKVEVDPVKLQDYGLSFSQVTSVLRADNFSQSAGTVIEGGREYFLRNLEQFETIDDIRNVAIPTQRGTVYLKDIATISDSYKDNTQITRVNGGYAVGIHILKQTDANTVTTCAAVKKELAAIAKENSGKLHYRVVMDQSDFINKSIANTERMILEGALLAVLVLFLFLRNMRSTLIIFTSIPLSIIATFVLLYFTDNSLNLITMGGLALGVGRIVDDSIVVFENIYRHRANGLLPIDAAVKGASEVGTAVMAATFTIIAVFFPIVFVEGLASVIFKPLALTISFAILCSLGVALTVIPLMSSRMLTDRSMAGVTGNTALGRAVKRWGVFIDSLGERYKRLLQWSLTHRKAVVIGVTILMVISLAVTPLVGAEFMPSMDSGEISISLETDKGTPLPETERLTKHLEREIRALPEVETVFTSVGGSANMMLDTGTQTNKSTIAVKLVPRGERKKSVNDIAEEIRVKSRDIAGAKITVSAQDAMSQVMSGSGSAISIQIKGDDLTVLKQLSTEVADIVREVPGTREVTSSLTDGNPEVRVKIDRMRAATYGLTPMQVAGEVQAAVDGVVATTYKSQGDDVDVRVRYSPGHRDLDYLKDMSIQTPLGVSVPLSQIASFEMAQGPIQITRKNQVRQAEITASLLNRDLNSVMKDIKARVDKLSLPEGYTVEYGGQNKEMMESFASLATALVLAIILVYAVMAVQYESFFNPFIIMFSVPTAFIGVVFSLLITGRSFSVTAFIGVIMLVGIVVSNAIVLVDYLGRLRQAGMERNAAIIEAGRVRLRPILMTALATILAMMPLALGLGEGGETQAPLATVVIGGLLVSTLVTLVLVPVVYSIFDDWGQKIAKKGAAKGTKHSGPAVNA